VGVTGAIATILAWAVLRAGVATLLLALCSLVGFALMPTGVRPARARLSIPASLSIGAGAVGWLCWIAGVLVGTAVILPLALALVILSCRQIRPWLSALVRLARHLGRLIRRNRLAAFVLSALLLTTLPLLVSPLIDSDGLRYHVALPKLFLLSHRIFFYEWDLVGGLPQLGESLYLIGLALTGGETAKFIHLGFFLAALTVLGLTVHRSHSTRAAALIAPFLYAATPVALVPVPAGFVDHIAIFHLGTAALMATFGGHPLVIGCCLGAAVGTKLTSLPAAGALALLVLARSVSAQRLRTLCYIGLPVLVAWAPFALRNAIETGDPAFPVGYSLLGRQIPGALPSASASVTRFHAAASGPLGIAWSPEPGRVQPDEVVGLHHLLGLFALVLAIREPSLRPLLAFVFVSFAIAVPFRPPTRLLLPLFWALAGFEALAACSLVKRFACLAALLVAIPALLVPFPLLLGTRGLLAYTTGKLDRESFVAGIVPGFRAASFVNTCPPGGRVMAMDFPASYYLDRPFIVEGIFNEPPLKLWLARERSFEGVLERLHALDVRYILVTPGYGGGRPISLLPLATSRESAERTLALRRWLRHLKTVDDVDVYEVPMTGR
jgi:hypothetical protein